MIDWLAKNGTSAGRPIKPNTTNEADKDKQMDFYQKWMAGKTVADLNAWFGKNTTTAGRPIKANTTNETDKAKFNLLTDAEKASLADVVSGATMSLEDPHGRILTSIKNAFKNSRLLGETRPLSGNAEISVDTVSDATAGATL